MSPSVDRSQDPSPFAWLMAGAVAAAGLGSLLAARRRKREERDLWAQAESGRAGSAARRPGAAGDEARRAEVSRHDAPRGAAAGPASDPDETVAVHPS